MNRLLGFQHAASEALESADSDSPSPVPVASAVIRWSSGRTQAISSMFFWRSFFLDLLSGCCRRFGKLHLGRLLLSRASVTFASAAAASASMRALSVSAAVSRLRTVSFSAMILTSLSVCSL